MFVYGIRCAPCDLSFLPKDIGNYSNNYGLVVFPTYSKTTCLNANGILSNSFWQSVKKITENSTRVQTVSLEDPYITDTESTVVDTLRISYPGISSGWYYCPGWNVEAALLLSQSDTSCLWRAATLSSIGFRYFVCWVWISKRIAAIRSSFDGGSANPSHVVLDEEAFLNMGSV